MSEAMQKTQGEHNPEDAPNLNPPLRQVALVEDAKEHDPVNDLLMTRNVRAQIVNYLTSKGVPADLGEVDTIKGLLKDIDAAALGKMRVQVESKQADFAEQNRLAVLAALGHLTDVKDAGQSLVSAPPVPREKPVLPDDIETRPFVPGEAAQGTVHQTFDQFQEKTGAVALNEKAVDD